VHTTLSAFVANPTTALALSSLKEQSGSNKHLLGSDPTQPSNRMIGGVPLYVSPSVAADTVWGIPKPHSIMVVRQDASVVTDTSVYFTSDRVAVRATLRASFGFTYPAAVVKTTLSP
jgi:HK97 family phage major capsid protein